MKFTIKSYKMVLSIIFIFMLDNVQADSLCKKEERIIFNCELQENYKFVSMCSSKIIDGNNGFLQYRYGKQGKVELIFPKAKNNSVSQFGYNEYSRPDSYLDTKQINFSNGGYEYSIQASITHDKDGNDENTGILNVYSNNRKRNLVLNCKINKNFISNLDSLSGVVKCDKKNEFVDGECGD